MPRAGHPGGDAHFQSVASGRALVVLPSFGLDHAAMPATLEPVFADLAGWGRLYLDLAGTAASPPGVPRSDAVADEAVTTIGAELGDEPFAILGWSSGAYLAAGVTRRVPRQICDLMVVCAGFKVRPEDRDLTGEAAPIPSQGG